MKLIVGLGNPGQNYLQTRHNIGFQFVDYLARQANFPAFSHQKKFQAETSRLNFAGEDILLVKPQTFMNNSGSAVRAIIQFYRLDPSQDLILVFDDLDLDIPQFKIQFGKGPHCHNGLDSVVRELGNNQNFTHFRIGVDGRGGERLIPASDYVLSKFRPEEFSLIEQNVFRKVNLSDLINR